MKLIFIFLLLTFLNCKKESITLTGSETLRDTANYLANEFMKHNRKYSLSVYGGGSQEGINKLRSKQTDIALVSRELTAKEKEEFGANLIQVVVAYDGAGIIVNPQNPIEEIYLEQVSDIFTGKITNWKELGGRDFPIEIVIRNEMSGTAAFFKEHIVQKKDLGADKFEQNADYTKNARVVKDNYELVDYISKNPNSIGYIGMGHAHLAKDKVKLLKYSRFPDEEKVIPSIQTIIQRKYKLARGLYFLYLAENTKVEEFITFATSEQGQQAIQKMGYLRSTLPEVEVKGNK
ncbi:MAG: phosphate ABC transporter substrate-binding protein [Leptospiraceae bacterium]|nr:phosphate ABC transporter substrate-binding protein [Leptospiraceae bacterium]